MAVSVLVITPTREFGQLLRQSLHDFGDYDVALAFSGPKAEEIAAKTDPQLCILDTDLRATPLGAMVGQLRQEHPGLRLILIPPQIENGEPDLRALDADVTLRSPFSLPDLLDTVDDLVRRAALADTAGRTLGAEDTSEDGEAASSPPEWLKDVTLAAQHLTRLSLESASQAALITRGGRVWAYAGELPRGAAEELAGVASRYWHQGSGGDLARFLRLEHTGQEHFLYATGLGGDFVLSLVFDAATPFSEIRSQAGRLAHALTTAPTEPLTDLEEELSLDTDQMMGEDVSVTPLGMEGEVGDAELFDGLDLSEVDPLLDDVPPPMPAEAPRRWRPRREPAAVDVVVEQRERRAPSRLEESLAETVPLPKKGTEEEVKVEPVSPALYNLTYACVLIPRLPEHHLTGELASRLADWITQLSLAFGWRLEHLSIRPGYLHWLVNVPPSTSPGYLIRIIRRHASHRLFMEFPAYSENNPSGDFWAPGYLIVSGTQPIPARMINDFIAQTRQRQGIIINHSE